MRKMFDEEIFEKFALLDEVDNCLEQVIKYAELKHQADLDVVRGKKWK
jgi:hypothetical protein